MARKLSPGDLPPQTDPRAPLDAATFLRAARPVLTRLTADLLTRADADEGVRHALARHHQAELAASRTADDYAVWRRRVVVQIAAAWLLSCVFVRVLEDRGLVAARIAGPGARDSEAAFFRIAPSLGERDYLHIVFHELTRYPVTAALFDPAHNLASRLGPSADACKHLLGLFRVPHADAPAFRFGQPDTRFLGDLYQDLDEDVRQHFALLQTPDFIEQFILDRTLDPAIAEYGIDHTDLIDPTCGSGHFLLGAFTRIHTHLRRAHPGLDDRKLASKTLEHIYGVDINPYAVSIARFRLTLQFLETGSYLRLAGAPAPVLHVIVADSLYYGFAGGQGDLGEQPAADLDRWYGVRFSLEDPEEARKILLRTYAAVVGNPPYITVKDPNLREFYRTKYAAASGQYALSAPFMQRFFQLAKEGGGYVGQITSNSFMKREFGVNLIEQVLPQYSIELIANTSGAFIPGHGTPTVLIFGRNRTIRDGLTRVILSRESEPQTPAVPRRGHVWSSIAEHWDEDGFENSYISVESVPAGRLATHPWSLEGSDANDLKKKIESVSKKKLTNLVETIGFASFTGLDQLFVVDLSLSTRHGVPEELVRPMIFGESIRDWGLHVFSVALCPYSKRSQTPAPPISTDNLLRFLWPYRTTCESVISFGGKTRGQLNEIWWHWYRWQSKRYSAKFRIVYASIATHNHYFLDRGGRAFSQTAPVILLKHGATEGDHANLLSYLNSSTACFYGRQITYPKGAHTRDTGASQGKSEGNRYDFSCTAISSLVCPDESRLASLGLFSLRMEAFQLQRDALSPHALLRQTFEDGSCITSAVSRAEAEDLALLHRMVAIQEDLDWAVYALFELAPPATAGRWTEGLELAPEQRPFKDPTPPIHLGLADRDLWLARAAAIADSKQLRLIENPVNKRRWWGARGVFGHKVATYAERVADAASEKIMDLAEQVLRARCQDAAPAVVTARELERELAGDPRYNALRDYLVTRNAGADPLREQLTRQSVPFLAGYRYSPAGLDRHARWQETWRSQRTADISEAELPPLRERLDAAVAAHREATARVAAERHTLGLPAFPLDAAPPPRPRGPRRSTAAQFPEPAATADTSGAPTLLAAEAQESHARAAQNQARLDLDEAERNHRKIRALIPVPGKYEPGDFRDPAYFRLRGKLDVPREAFISYPGAASDSDGALVYGWAGWNHLQRALALLQLYYHRKLEEAWPPERLVPLLAGLEELLPWVRQWHADERHTGTGERYVDALDAHIDSGCGDLGVTRQQLVLWAPPDARAARAARPSRSNSRRVPVVPADTSTTTSPRLSHKQHAAAGSTDDGAPARKRSNNLRDPPLSDAPAEPTLASQTATKTRGRPRKSGIR